MAKEENRPAPWFVLSCGLFAVHQFNSRGRKSEEELRLEETVWVSAALLASGLAKWESRMMRLRLQSVILQSREQAASD